MQVKRKKFLINPDFQFRIIAWMAGFSLAPICAFFGAHYFFFWKLRKLGQEINLEPDHVYYRFIAGQSQTLFLIFLVCAALTVISVFVFGLLLSHKIAGPIHRLKSHLSKLAEGADTGDLTFRKDDYFTELPPLVNESVKALKGQRS